MFFQKLTQLINAFWKALSAKTDTEMTRGRGYHSPYQACPQLDWGYGAGSNTQSMPNQVEDKVGHKAECMLDQGSSGSTIEYLLLFMNFSC